MIETDLSEVLKLYKLWLEGKEGGVRADISNTDLSGANLSNTDLSGANLRKADLRKADLSGANLRKADLSNTDLSGAGGLKGVARLDFGGWSICVHGARTTIGCVSKDSTWWVKASDDEIVELMRSSKSLEWWEKYGDAVKAVIKATGE